METELRKRLRFLRKANDYFVKFYNAISEGLCYTVHRRKCEKDGNAHEQIPI